MSDDAIFDARSGSMQAHAISGALAIGIAQLAKLPFQAASLLFLPRLLTPTDYGIYAMVDPIVSVMGLLLNFGIGQAIIQAPSLTRAQASGMFWIMAALGCGGALIMLAASPLVALLYHEPRAGVVAAASSLFLVVGGLTNVQESLLNRQMKFGWLAAISAVSIGVGLLVAVIAAAMGGHYWALTLDYAATSVVTLIGVWIGVGWTPREQPDFKGTLPLFKFGGAVMASDAAAFVAREADNVLLGRYAGPAQLGLYDRGRKLSLIPLQRINQVLQYVMVPVLSRLAQDRERYRRAYLRIIRLLMLLLTPGIVAIGATAQILVPFLIGPQWAGAAPIFAWLTLAALHRPVSMTMNFLFVSQGRAKAYVIWSVFSAVTSLAAIVVGLRWGAIGVAAAFGLTDLLLRLPFLWWWVTRQGPITQLDLYRTAAPFAVGAAACFAALLVLQRVPMPNHFLFLAVNASAAYAVAWSVAAAFKSGRAAMTDALGLARNELARFVQTLAQRFRPQP